MITACHLFSWWNEPRESEISEIPGRSRARATRPSGRIIPPLLALLLSLTLPVLVEAQFNYTIGNGTITITGHTGPGGAVTLPDTLNGLPVTGIGWGAFLANSNLVSVTIPDGVTRIGDVAFANCGSLLSIVLPGSVDSIGRGAFANCSLLTDVTIPHNVTTIGGYAFYGCAGMTAITVDARNASYSSLDGVLFNQGQTTLIRYPGSKAGSYTVPGSVAAIERWAFEGCTGLTHITLPNSVTSVEEGAFSGCTGLTDVVIPNSLGSINRAVFSRCTSLTDIVIPDGVRSLEHRAFHGCASLTNVVIPNSVTNIGGSAFESCVSLANVVIPNSVRSIEWGAFSGCTSLISVTIPESVSRIGSGAFSGCTSLTAITVDARNASYRSMDGVLFNLDRTTLIQCPGGKAGNYTVPKSVTGIEFDAFRGCASLAGVTIPGSVTTIGGGAFSECASLTAIYFLGDAVSLHGFDANYATVYYLPGTAGWQSFFGGRPTVLWDPRIQSNDVNFGVRSSQFGFNVTASSELTIVVEACTNLAEPTWAVVGTNTLAGGGSNFSDPHWTNHPARFYRLRSP